jgi:hypothetical protein
MSLCLRMLVTMYQYSRHIRIRVYACHYIHTCIRQESIHILYVYTHTYTVCMAGSWLLLPVRQHLVCADILGCSEVSVHHPHMSRSVYEFLLYVCV